MVPSISRSLGRTIGLAGLLVLAALAAQAQSPARSARPDPLDPKASVPPLVYASSLKPGTAAAADKPLGWREANDTVARIGGWRVYAREAQQPDPADAAKPAPTSLPPPATDSAKPMPAGHAGHKMP